MTYKVFYLRPWFIPLIITLTLTCLILVFSDRGPYKIEPTNLDSFGVGSKGINPFYHDLNNDGVSEEVSYFPEPEADFYVVQIFDLDGGIFNQWNFHSHSLDRIVKPIIGDFDNDGYSEIIIFTSKFDSIFMNVIEPLDSVNPVNLRKKLVSTMDLRDGKIDFTIQTYTFHDFNSDKKQELVFHLGCGYSRQPRQLIIYDFVNNEFDYSESIGSNLGDIHIYDLDKDGNPEIFGGSVGCGNIPDSMDIPYSDYSAWVISYNDQLSLSFPPVEYSGFRSGFKTIPYFCNDSTYILALAYHTGSEKKIPRIYILDHNGSIIREKILDDKRVIDRDIYNFSRSRNNRIVMSCSNGEIYLLDDELNFTKELKLNTRISTELFSEDLNQDDKKEYFTYSTDDPKIFIISNSLEEITEYDIAGIRKLNRLHIVNNGNEKYIAAIGEERTTFFTYKKDYQYYLRFLILPLVFFGLFFFIILIRKLQMIQIQRKEEMRKNILELQLKGLKNQMDPHFTYNTFNTISSFIHKECKEFYGPFIKFTNLVRNTLDSSDKVTRSVEDELHFLEDYISLEQMRFPDKFSYEIHVAEEVDPDMKIPKMILHNFTENAIKHGLLPKEGKGKLEISLKMINKDLLIKIKDDGIGKEKAAELRNGSTGKGILMMKEYYKLIHEYLNIKVSSETIDLKKPTGTEVNIRITLP